MLIKTHLLALHKDLYHNPSKLVSFILISNFNILKKFLFGLTLNEESSIQKEYTIFVRIK